MFTRRLLLGTTFAAGTPAFVVSVTVPSMLLLNCADARPAKRSARTGESTW